MLNMLSSCCTGQKHGYVQSCGTFGLLRLVVKKHGNEESDWRPVSKREHQVLRCSHLMHMDVVSGTVLPHHIC